MLPSWQVPQAGGLPLAMQPTGSLLLAQAASQPAGGAALLGAGAGEGCQVLSDALGVVMQGLLFLVVMGSLWLKWWTEKPRRRLMIFALDSSKQVVGAGAIHAVNLALSMLFGGSFSSQGADECAWYWANLMLDTTFGVFVCWVLLRLTERLLGYSSGCYMDEARTGIDWEGSPDYAEWARQIAAWCGVVGAMKLIVLFVLWCFASSWAQLSMVSTCWVGGRQARLVFVMIITPTFMNIFQFCVTDSYLKHAQRSRKESMGFQHQLSQEKASLELGMQACCPLGKA